MLVEKLNIFSSRELSIMTVFLKREKREGEDCVWSWVGLISRVKGLLCVWPFFALLFFNWIKVFAPLFLIFIPWKNEGTCDLLTNESELKNKNKCLLLLIVKFIFIIVGNNINVTSEKVLMLLFGLHVKYDIKLEEYQYNCYLLLLFLRNPQI